MRLASLLNLKPGVKLAKPLLDEKGMILLGAGVTMSDFLIKRLLSLGITSIYIEDGRTEGIIAYDVISQQTRQEALGLVHGTVQALTTAEKFPRHFQQPMLGRKIRDLFDQILHEMKSNQGLAISIANIYTVDGELYHHSLNVSLLAMALGLASGLNEKQLLDLGVGTLLHDIGKLKIPPEILNKPGKLTPDEYEIIKQHAEFGYQMLRVQDDISATSAHVAYQHHERVDGTGYPRGLKGDEIHLFGKLVAVADVYEALTANRVYRRGQLPHLALELLMGGSGTHFDPGIVKLFLATIAVYPVGMTVTLNTGETGVVVAVPKEHPQRPTIRVIQDAQGKDLQVPYDLELAKHLTTMIVQCAG